MPEPPDPLAAILAAYQAAVLAKDVDAFAALYDDDVYVFDMWDTWSLQGIAAWRGIAGAWFSSLGAEQVYVRIREARCIVADTLAVGHAILTYTACSAEGRPLRSLDNRITLGLQRRGTVWKIVHEHTSAPIDHRSLHATLTCPQPASNPENPT
ncbi:YybH family protein [Chitiniphilus eburneus]|uniref:DUF4440 domain-containing protein n=1 Tax=Chitiniphilus eburneus TaxID=2571148 RepID=A0A4U0Q018_9NEIS|nr:nuclear transport factor 2 family protein [Chitiniphilus eburneus]TJZ74199.1 DUF4440 domain-containing protein [Chitiniphilus eburneus]